MSCPHRINNECNLGNQLAIKANIKPGIRCEDDTYNTCINCKCPHTYNHVVASITLSHFKFTETEFNEQLFNLIRQGPNCKIGGPGTELKRLLSYVKLLPEDNGTCDCEWHVSEMDYWGSEECRKRIDEICEWLIDQAKKRGLMWNKLVIDVLILSACDLSDGASWIDIITTLPLTLLGF